MEAMRPMQGERAAGMRRVSLLAGAGNQAKRCDGRWFGELLEAARPWSSKQLHQQLPHYAWTVPVAYLTAKRLVAASAPPLANLYYTDAACRAIFVSWILIWRFLNFRVAL